MLHLAFCKWCRRHALLSAKGTSLKTEAFAVCQKQPACQVLQAQPTSNLCMEPFIGASRRLPPFSLCRDLRNVIGARSTLSAHQALLTLPDNGRDYANPTVSMYHSGLVHMAELADVGRHTETAGACSDKPMLSAVLEYLERGTRKPSCSASGTAAWAAQGHCRPSTPASAASSTARRSTPLFTRGACALGTVHLHSQRLPRYLAATLSWSCAGTGRLLPLRTAGTIGEQVLQTVCNAAAPWSK